jgi:hypothetical protein
MTLLAWSLSIQLLTVDDSGFHYKSSGLVQRVLPRCCIAGVFCPPLHSSCAMCQSCSNLSACSRGTLGTPGNLSADAPGEAELQCTLKGGKPLLHRQALSV